MEETCRRILKKGAQIFKLLRIPGIDSTESILPANVAWRVGVHDNPIPTRFLAPQIREHIRLEMATN